MMALRQTGIHHVKIHLLLTQAQFLQDDQKEETVVHLELKMVCLVITLLARKKMIEA